MKNILVILTIVSTLGVAAGSYANVNSLANTQSGTVSGQTVLSDTILGQAVL